MAAAPLQSFTTVLGRAKSGNTQNIDRIGGLQYVNGSNGPELLVNAFEYYDADGDVTHTTLAIRDATDLANSPVDGFFQLPGGAHASGWFSPVPTDWREIVGGAFITGFSSGWPIISRLSVGPAAFSFDPFAIVGADPVVDPIETTTLLDYALTQEWIDPAEKQLAEDLDNASGTNDLWTHISRATFGFIAPGTRSYIVFGDSGRSR